eukprot:4488463-Pyramimonas_sp.AAC.1
MWGHCGASWGLLGASWGHLGSDRSKKRVGLISPAALDQNLAAIRSGRYPHPPGPPRAVREAESQGLVGL